jgi:hypothetical protein
MHDTAAWCAQGRSVLGQVGDYLDKATCQSHLTGGKSSLLRRHRSVGNLSDAILSFVISQKISVR